MAADSATFVTPQAGAGSSSRHGGFFRFFFVHEAAWARAAGRDVAKLAPMAKLFACDTYRDVTATAQQIFGGIGFTVEFDIQLYFRRAKQLQLSWFDSRTLEELVAAAVLDG